jgi:oligosaccharide repeat unit polymerase
MNETIICILCVSFLVLILLSKLLFKSLRNPVFVICIWWNACLLLSNIIVIGVGISLQTVFVFLLFIYSIFGFGVLFYSSSKTVGYPIPAIIRKYKAIWIILAVLAYLLSVWLGIQGYRLQGVYGEGFRALSFSTGDYSSLLYGSYYLQVLANLILSPLVLFGIIAFSVVGVFYNNYKWLIAGFVFSTAVSFQGSGRFPLYYFALATVLGVMFARNVRFLFFVKLIAVLPGSLLIMGVISRQRVEAEEFNIDIVRNMIEQGIAYHVIGINLFDREFTNEDSALHKDTSLGRLSLFSYPDKVICMALRRFGISANPTIDTLGESWQKNVLLGNDDLVGPIETNAFYTTLYPLYYDFRYIGIVLIPGIYVYFLMKHFQAYRRHKNLTSLFVMIFLTVFFITSIFDSKITAPDFTVIMYCVFFVRAMKQFPALNKSVVAQLAE